MPRRFFYNFFSFIALDPPLCQYAAEFFSISCAVNSFGSPIKSMVQRRKSQTAPAGSAGSDGGPADAAEDPSGIRTTRGGTLSEGERERCLIEIVDPGKRFMLEAAAGLGALGNEEGMQLYEMTC